MHSNTEVCETTVNPNTNQEYIKLLNARRLYRLATKYVPTFNTAPPSKNAVSANIKHSIYFHLTSNFWSIRYCGKRLYVHMFDMVYTAFSYGRTLVVC